MDLKDLGVLYIDNPVNYTQEVEAVLEKLFKNYIDANTLEDSIRTFKDEFIDLVIVNIDYEKANGQKFIEVIKQKAPEFPIIAVIEGDDIKGTKELFNKKNIHIDLVVRSPLEAKQLEDTINGMQKAIVEFASNREDRKKPKEVKSPGVEESIDLYFRRFNDELRRSNNKKYSNRKMDFSIMKTFLYTAYNNFKETDARFEDEHLKLAKRNLEKALKNKKDLEKKLSGSIEENYERVFLMQQTEYVQMKTEFDESGKKIVKFRNSLSFLTKQIEDFKEQLKFDSKKGSKEAEETEKKLKEVNKKHVDRVHAIASLKERLDELEEKIIAFKAKYKEEFQSVFLSKSDQISKDLTQSIDYAAYNFDREMWRCAKQSKPIREFFENSKIDGLFSAKTYLEYYLKGVDKTVASENTKKLLRYKNEYNRTNKIEVAVIVEDMQKATWLKTNIEKIDRMIKVTGFLNFERAIQQYKVSQFDTVIIDEFVDGTPANNIVEEFEIKYPNDFRFITFCIALSTKRKSRVFDECLSKGITHLVSYDMNSGDLYKKILEIL